MAGIERALNAFDNVHDLSIKEDTIPTNYQHTFSVQNHGIGVEVTILSERTGSDSDKTSLTLRGDESFQNDFSMHTEFYGNLERDVIAEALRKAADLLEM